MDQAFREEYLSGLYIEMKKFEELQTKFDVPELGTYSETVLLRINQIKHDAEHISGYSDEAFVLSIKKVYVALVSYFGKFLEKHKFRTPAERSTFESTFILFRDNVNLKLQASTAAIIRAGQTPSINAKQIYAKEASERVLSIFAALCRMHESMKRYL